MGIKLFSSSVYDGGVVSIPPANPDPANWQILESRKIANMLIIRIKYPDCTNYEGEKLLVYEGVALEELKAQLVIDPHFSANKKFHSPVARFEPTGRGWRMACAFVNTWSFNDY
jgi:hypothetical protein